MENSNRTETLNHLTTNAWLCHWLVHNSYPLAHLPLLYHHSPAVTFSTVEWSFPWKELITKATATALSAVEAWGNQLVTEDTTSTIVIYGEEKNTETVCLLVWADNGRCQNDLPCSDKWSECHSTWGMETSVQHIVLLVLPNICSWLLCMFLCVVVQSIFKK